jgi:hypothetical protein
MAVSKIANSISHLVTLTSIYCIGDGAFLELTAILFARSYCLTPFKVSASFIATVATLTPPALDYTVIPTILQAFFKGLLRSMFW